MTDDTTTLNDRIRRGEFDAPYPESDARARFDAALHAEHGIAAEGDPFVEEMDALAWDGSFDLCDVASAFAGLMPLYELYRAARDGSKP